MFIVLLRLDTLLARRRFTAREQTKRNPITKIRLIRGFASAFERPGLNRLANDPIVLSSLHLEIMESTVAIQLSNTIKKTCRSCFTQHLEKPDKCACFGENIREI
jgi:hypothetical protein